MAISDGFASVLRADANLRDFKLTDDGGVKERSSLDKLFTRIVDHFRRKSADGRHTINERNHAVGNAMLKLVAERAFAQLEAVGDDPEFQEHTDFDAYYARKSDIRKTAQALTHKINVLNAQRELPPEILSKMKKLGPDTMAFLDSLDDNDIKTKVISLLGCNIDKGKFVEKVGGTLLDHSSYEFDNPFDAQKGNPIVSCPAVAGSDENPAAMTNYIDNIARGSKMVKDFLVTVCHNHGLPFAVKDAFRAKGFMGKEMLPDAQQYTRIGLGIEKLNSTKFPDSITVTTRKDGSIDVRANLHFKAKVTDGADLAGFRVAMKMHLPVDEHGLFKIGPFRPDYEMEDVSITNMHLD